MKRRVVAFLLSVVAASVLGGQGTGPALAAQQSVEERCTVPDWTIALDGDLPRVRQRLDRQQPLALLVVNSGNPRVQRPAPTYPARLQARLAKRFPTVGVGVETLHFTGKPASAMVAPLKRAVAERRPDLVIWQTGTVDAIHGLDIEDFGNALNDGVVAVQSVGADIIIMDMQYSQQTAQLIDFSPYLTYFHWVSQDTGAFHFPRHEIMRRWVESGAVQFGAEAEKDERDAFVFVHDCIAELLAASIVAMTEFATGQTH